MSKSIDNVCVPEFRIFSISQYLLLEKYPFQKSSHRYTQNTWIYGLDTVLISIVFRHSKDYQPSESMITTTGRLMNLTFTLSTLLSPQNDWMHLTQKWILKLSQYKVINRKLPVRGQIFMQMPSMHDLCNRVSWCQIWKYNSRKTHKYKRSPLTTIPIVQSPKNIQIKGRHEHRWTCTRSGIDQQMIGYCFSHFILRSHSEKKVDRNLCTWIVDFVVSGIACFWYDLNWTIYVFRLERYTNQRTRNQKHRFFQKASNAVRVRAKLCRSRHIAVFSR